MIISESFGLNNIINPSLVLQQDVSLRVMQLIYLLQ